MRKTACKCKKTHKRSPSSSLSLFSGILIALLPKCPFCILAYSSAITLCSGKTLYPEGTNYMLYVVLGLMLFILALIAYNFKGRRTYYAIGLILTASLFLASYYFFEGNFTWYYTGVVLLLTGVWMNGSLYHFVGKLFQKFKGFRRPKTITSLSASNEN